MKAATQAAAAARTKTRVEGSELVDVVAAAAAAATVAWEAEEVAVATKLRPREKDTLRSSLEERS